MDLLNAATNMSAYSSASASPMSYDPNPYSEFPYGSTDFPSIHFGEYLYLVSKSPHPSIISKYVILKKIYVLTGMIYGIFHQNFQTHILPMYQRRKKEKDWERRGK